ncbi:MAG TPA: tRNA (guanosine(46)-N7)-methyltransferase TrmB [Spirochaetota bacterium]|nr:tRNA (guanosine(46)-N7)-methyltransferase TrmB [Spirochaetota bacterium]
MPACRLKSIKVAPALLNKYLVKPLPRQRINTIKPGENSDFRRTAVLPYNLQTLTAARSLHYSSRIILEAACGKGDFLTDIAAANPDCFYIGVDYAYPVILRAVKRAAALMLDNILFYWGDIKIFLKYDFEKTVFTQIFINFPDPWPKRKHHKRRIIQKDTAGLFCKALQQNSWLVIATDIKELYMYHNNVLKEFPQLVFMNSHDPFTIPYSGYKTAISTYEQKGEAAGRHIYYAVYKKILEKERFSF